MHRCYYLFSNLHYYCFVYYILHCYTFVIVYVRHKIGLKAALTFFLPVLFSKVHYIHTYIHRSFLFLPLFSFPRPFCFFSLFITPFISSPFLKIRNYSLIQYSIPAPHQMFCSTF